MRMGSGVRSRKPTDGGASTARLAASGKKANTSSRGPATPWLGVSGEANRGGPGSRRLVEADQVPGRVGDGGERAELLVPDGLRDAGALPLQLGHGAFQVAHLERDVGRRSGMVLRRTRVEGDAPARAHLELGPALLEVE